MSEHRVVVNQLRAGNWGTRGGVRNPFMNVRTEYGMVGVETITSLPTFVVFFDYVMGFMQFCDVDYARDYFTRHQAYITGLMRGRFDSEREPTKLFFEEENLKDWLIPEDDLMYPGRIDQKENTLEEIEESLGWIQQKLDEEDKPEVTRIISLLRGME